MSVHHFPTGSTGPLGPATIAKREGVCGGRACVDGTRIPVWILEGLRRDTPTSLILGMYPRLTMADLRAAWAYASAHRAEIDADIAENLRDEP